MTPPPAPALAPTAAAALVERVARLQAREARLFLAEARTLVELEAVAESLDPVFGAAVWAAEAAVATGRSEGSVRHRTAQAHALLDLPALCTALEVGLLSRAHAHSLLEALAEVPPHLHARVAAAVVEPVLRADGPGSVPAPGQLAGQVRRTWYRLDATAVAQAREDAVATRAVWVRHLTAPGVSSLGATHTAESVAAAKDRLARAALVPSDPDDLRTAAQREADLALALLTHGRLPDTVLPAAALQLTLHCPVETVQGLSDEPGLLEGVGLLDAEHCRTLARTAALTTVEADPVTRVPLRLDESLAGARPGVPAARDPRTPDELRRTVNDILATPAPRADRRCLDVGTVEDRYRPGARVSRLARARHPEGAAPLLASWRHDLDHRLAWPVGPTSAENLTPLSRRWHRLKQAGWSYRPGPDGSVLWTSPTGRRAVVPPSWARPERLRLPAPPPSEQCRAGADPPDD